jgi:hypothetical protein
MPLFESQSSRSERLIRAQMVILAKKATQAYSDAPGLYQRILIAASVSAATAVRFEPLRGLWGKGDDAKAADLLRCFTFPQISRVNELVQGKAPPEERIEMFQTFFDLFEDHDQQAFSRVLLFDLQHSRDRHRAQRIQATGGFVIEPQLGDQLFLNEALHSQGAASFVRIPMARLPLTDYDYGDLIAAGWLTRVSAFDDLENDIQVWMAIQGAFNESILKNSSFA